MRSKGNANPAICANNLARISRGEVVYDRIQGVKFADILRAGADAQKELAEDTAWMIGVYEPRVAVRSVSVETTNAALGSVSVRVDLAEG